MLSELRSATRGLVKWRGRAVVAVLTLAIGIGTTAGLYALVRVLLEEMPGVPELNRLARVYASSQTLGVERSQVALNEYDATLSRATSFSAIGAYTDADAILGSAADVRPAIVGFASPSFFAAMGVPPIQGRVFVAGDSDDARHPVILSHALWRRQFPDGRIVDATILVDGVAHTVVGVMPSDFHYGFAGISADLWIPLGRASIRTPAIVNVYARLKNGVDWPAAQAELAALSPAQAGGGQWTWRAIPLNDDVRGHAIGAYAGTLLPALLVLLIACVNVACLLMARGIERDKELSVRRALGATRGRVIRLLLVENMVLALVSGLFGGALALGILRVLAAMFAAFEPSVVPRLSVSASLLGVAVAASAIACLVFGAGPALRLSKRDVTASLNGLTSPHRIPIAGYGWRDAIVFAEIAAAVGLVVWTAMLYTLFAHVGAVRFAVPADRVVAMRVPARTAADVAERVAAIPGVTRTAISSGMLGGGERARVETADGRATVVSRIPVGDGFLDTLGIALVRGRAFDAPELHGRAGVAILSESAARRLAPGGDAVGLRLRAAERPSVVVVGICRDAIDSGALSDAGTYAPSEMYVPYEAPVTASEAVVVARLSIDPHPALRAIAEAARIPAASRPARPVILSDDMNGRGADGAMIATKILGTFAWLTLILAASGVFAVISQSVALRTREFGIRLAIGATPRRVLGMVLAREMKLIALGIAVGLAFTMALTRALFVELVRLNAVVPGMWVGALVCASTAVAIALAFATYRIVRLEPAVVLRRS
jgi:putative ABC transport system permease protein